MHFGHIEIFSIDPARAQAFYQDLLGFELTTVQPGGHIWLKKDQVEILIRPGQPPRSPDRYEHSAVGFVLYTDRLDQVLAEARQRGLEVKGVVDSARCFTFTDPDGNWFQLVDPAEH